ncbi:thermonuclease family protein [Kordiimonas aquimaris]|uniref:thermonuclease family protein n=1 Tax=Kordiimonas aquimaris TaxID=707591 RepID=UPI0021CF3066|nr:thermonuclease family protein [Kordiimonas aquimaris]
MTKWASNIIATIFLLSYSALADNSAVPSGLKFCGKISASQAKDGETIITVDGKTIKLAGIKAPELWPEDAPYQSWPHAHQSRKLLDIQTASKTLEMFCEGERSDYTGAMIAHIKLPNGQWLQHSMIAAGGAYVYPRRTHTTGMMLLYAAEQKARKEEKGIWAQSEQTITTADGTIRTGWFQIISGKILSAKNVRKTIFLNFGENWRTDFTVEITPKVNKAFKKNQIDLLSFEGRNVEVRGWVTWKSGPHIMLESPGQIQILE